MDIDRGKKLLLVEDEAIIAMVTAKMLKRSGYDVITAGNGKKAVETALTDSSIDLILMDIDLGAGINGPEAARQILLMQNIPIVFLTSHSEQEVVEMVKEITRYGYVIKNSGDFVLLSSIEMAFELFASHQRLKASADVLRESEERVQSKLDSILSPEGDIGELELADVVDIKTLQSIMEDFNTITESGMAIVDLKGKVLIATGWQNICTKFHRINPDSCRNCLESDTVLSSGVPFGAYKLYKCKNNMWDMATPIEIGGKHMGNLFLGQFLFEDEVIDYELFRLQAKQFGFDEEKYIEALESVPRLGRDTVFSSMTFYIKVMNIISKLSYSNIKLAKTLSERDHYSDLHKMSEQRLVDITDYMVDLVARLDRDGFFTYVSPSYERILGYRPEELVGTWAPDLAHPATKEKDIEETKKICDAGEGYAEFRLRHKDGTYRWFEASGSNIYDGNGIAAGSVMGARDITERKKAEKKLSKKDRQYKELFESMIDGFAIHEIVADDWGNPVDYIFLEVNPAFEQLTGLKAADIIGKRVTDLMPDIEPYWIATYGQVAMTGVQLTIENYSHQLNKWFKVTAYSSERGYFATIFEDITGRKSAEELLKERDERYKRLFESVVGYVYTVYIQNKIPVKTVHGPGCEAITGYTPENFITDPELWYKVIYPDDRGRVILFASDIINKGVFTPVEHRIVCRDGSISWVRNTPVPRYDNSGNLIEYDSVIADITERKMAELSLKESRELLLNIINSSPDYIFVKDTGLRLVMCNEVYARAMNSTPAELTGKTDIESGWGEEYVKGNIQKGIRGYEADDLRALSGENVTVENEKAVIKGELHYFDTLKVPLYKNGKITSLLGISRDITERVAMGKKFREIENQFRAIAENAPLGIYMTDKEGDCIYANRRWLEMAGLKLEEAAGKGWVRAIHPDDRESVSEKWYMSVESGGFWGYEYRFLNSSGNVTWVFGNATAIADDNGQVIGYVGTNLDITERIEISNLQKSQIENYRTVAEFTYDWELWMGVDGRMIYCSPSCERITGYSKDEFLNDPALLSRIVFHEDHASPCVMEQDIKEFPKMNETEFRITRKDGRIAWIGHVCQAVYDSTGNFAGRRGSNRDITKEKLARMETESARARLDDLWSIAIHADESLKTICDYILSTIVRITQSVYGFYGFINESETEMMIYSWSGEAMKDCSMAQKPQNYKIEDCGVWAEAVRMRSDLLINDYKSAHPAKKGYPSGHVELNNLMVIPVFVEGKIKSVVAVANSENGYSENDRMNLKIFMTNIQSVIQKKQADEKLGESEMKLKALMNSTTDGAFLMTTEGVVIEANKTLAERFGLTVEQIIGVNIYDLIPPENVAPRRNRIEGVIETGQPLIFEDSRGGIFLESHVYPIKDITGEVVSISVFSRDITERKNSFEKINSLLKEKEMLLSEVHHRIKNNMNTISGLLMLQAASISEPAAVTALNDARSRVQSMMIMYDKLYRSEDYRKMSVKEYLEKFIDEIFVIFENSRQVRIEKDIEDFVLDTKILFPVGIIINELITNAFKYAFPGGREGKIEVSLSKKNDEVHLSIKDDGIGVPLEVASSKSGGFGLNLVSALTEQIGGEVKIRKDNGTVVEIVFKPGV